VRTGAYRQVVSCPKETSTRRLYFHRDTDGRIESNPERDDRASERRPTTNNNKPIRFSHSSYSTTLYSTVALLCFALPGLTGYIYTNARVSLLGYR